MLTIWFRNLSLLLLACLLAACSFNKYSIIKPRDGAYLNSHSTSALEVPSDLMSPGDKDVFFVPPCKKGAIPASLIPPGSILQRTGKA